MSHIDQTLCLGPIARPQLGACLRHSEAAAHLHSPLIIAHICTNHIIHYIIILHTINKDTSWAEPTTHNIFICTLRHNGSAEPALPIARRKLRLVREKEKRNSPGIHPCSQLNHCPKGKTSYIRIFVQKTDSYKGSGESRIKQRTVDTRNQNHFVLREYVLSSRCGS